MSPDRLSVTVPIMLPSLPDWGYYSVMFGIAEGPSGNQNQQFNNLSGVSSTAANMGLSDIGQSTDFMSAILSGDPAKIGQVLGPQIAGIQGQGQQRKQTNAEFGNRSGGTNATNQTIDDSTRTQTNDLISNLTGSAVSGLANTGTNLLNTGVSGFGTSFSEATTLQNEQANKINDIFSSIGNVVTGAVTGGFGAGASPFGG